MMSLKKKMDPSTSNSISSSPSEEMGTAERTDEMEQVSSDLMSLKTLYGLLRRGPTDEILDETSRAFMTKMLDDTTRQTLLRQAKMLSPALESKLSIQSDHRRTRGDAVPVPVLKPIASLSPSLHAKERTSRLRTQVTVRSRDSRHAHDDRLLARVASNSSPRTSVAPHHRQSPERRLYRLSSHRSSRAVTARYGTVAGGTPRSDMRWPRRGDHSSMERGSSRRRSLSREPSSAVQERGRRLHRGATPAALRVGADDGSSTRRLGRLNSGLSESMVSRRGSQQTGSGAATPKLSSSTDAAATICSRIMPNRDLMERSLRRAGKAEDESPRRLRGKEKYDDDAASVSMGWPSRPRRTLNRINSGSTYSCSTCPTKPPSGASGSSSSWVPPRGNAPPEYGFHVSGASRSRHLRRQERKERRAGRMRRFKAKLGMVFHHRHDLHYHHFGPSGSKEGPRLSSRDVRRDHHHLSPWRFLGGVFHRATRVPAKRRGGGGNALFHMWGKRWATAKRRGGGGHALFHMWGKRRATASAGMWGTGSRWNVKKLHWWQRMRRRRRSGHGKAVWS